MDKAKYIADQELKIEREKELAKVKEYENAEQLRIAIRSKYDKKQAKIDIAFGYKYQHTLNEWLSKQI